MRPRADRSGPVSPQVLYVLMALLDEPRHGYGIMQDIEQRTDGEITLLPTSLYATLKRMLDDGLIVDAPELDRADSSPGRPRKTYRITERGRQKAADELRRMTLLLDVARDKRHPALGSAAEETR